MFSTLQPEDCLPPFSLEPRTAAGHVSRRTDTPTKAKDQPKRKPKAAVVEGSNGSDPKKLSTGERGDEDSDDDDKKGWRSGGAADFDDEIVPISRPQEKNNYPRPFHGEIVPLKQDIPELRARQELGFDRNMS